MLRPADLSLESVISLADLPIPGFPKSSEKPPGSSPTEGSEGKDGADVRAAEAAGAGDADDEVEEESEEDVMEFAYTELGASVVECSSNSETSGGILQVNILKHVVVISRGLCRM